VTFTVKASPDSYVALLAVDQSVLLLKSGNDITKEMVDLRRISSRFIMQNEMNRWSRRSVSMTQTLRDVGGVGDRRE